MYQFEIRNLLNENNLKPPEDRVDVPLGELRQIADLIRIQAINLENSTSTDEIQQVQSHLKNLYKELTDLEINQIL